MRKSLILAGASLLVAAPLIAQQTAGTPPTAPRTSGSPGAADPSRVAAGTYRTDPSHTLIGWRVGHFGFNDYWGIFGDAEGTLTIDPANPAASRVEITIPIGKVTTASEGLTKHLLNPDFFDVAQHPQARFTSTRVTVHGTHATIAGDLTLNGVTKPVTLDTNFVGAGANPMSKAETIGFHATTTIKRSDFGVDYALPAVSDEVALDISVAFEKQG